MTMPPLAADPEDEPAVFRRAPRARRDGTVWSTCRWGRARIISSLRRRERRSCGSARALYRRRRRKRHNHGRETALTARNPTRTWPFETPGIARSSTSGWPRTSAYEDELEPYAEPEAELQDTYRERPNVRRLSSAAPARRVRRHLRRRPEPERRTTVAAPGRPDGGNGRGGGDVRVHFVAPKSFNDVQDVADKFKDSIPVILNLQGTDTDLVEAPDRLLQRPHLRARRGHAADRRQGVPADAAQRRGIGRRARPAGGEGLLQPELSGSPASGRSRGWQTSSPCEVGLIGAGNMARALARGWGDPVLVLRRRLRPRAAALAAELGGEALATRRWPSVPTRGAVPQAGPARAGGRGDRAAPSRPWRRCSAATDVERAAGRVPGDAGVPADAEHAGRGPPRGRSCYAPAGAPDRPGARAAQVLELFERLGSVVTLPERMSRPPPRSCGVGPAYQALLAEAQVDAAVRHGLPADAADRLVVETMAGTAALLADARLRHAGGPPRGDVARRLDRARARGARARRAARRLPGRDRRGRRLEAGVIARSPSRAVDVGELRQRRVRRSTSS